MYSFLWLLRGLQVGWASKAEALFRRMYEVSLIPDRGTFLALMSAYASCDMARSAAAAFQGMLRMGQAQSQSQSHSQATDVASCNALLAAHLAHPEEALSLLRSMADLYGVEPDASSYQLVSEALAAAGMWQGTVLRCAALCCIALYCAWRWQCMTSIVTCCTPFLFRGSFCAACLSS